MLHLSEAERLLAHTPITKGDMLLMLVEWYHDFSVSDFDTRRVVPQHPVTL